jgi:opacity protein-like surface antigen
MKTLLFCVLFIITLAPFQGVAQEINWRSLSPETKHLGSINVGGDYGSYFGGSYGYQWKRGTSSIIIGHELTLPFGDDVLDDFKMKTSMQSELWRAESLSLAVKTGFIFRGYESEMASMYNVGADITLSFGYLKSRWGLEAIMNYDRSMATHIDNKLLKEYYPEIKDGWYDSSGGNFKFGIRANRSLGSSILFLNFGKAFGQDFEDNPTLPFYFDVSLQRQY